MLVVRRRSSCTCLFGREVVDEPKAGNLHPTSLRVMNLLYDTFAVLVLPVAYAAAESHTVSFDDR